MSAFMDKVLSIVNTENEKVNGMIKYIINAPSKLFRPQLGLLLHRFLRTVDDKNEKSSSHGDSLHSSAPDDIYSDSILHLLRAYEIVHVGTLIHDDVLDDSDTRRTLKSIHNIVGTKAAILIGDLMLTRACHSIILLDSKELNIRMANSLENLIKGELMQVKYSENLQEMFESYLRKIFLKTASLIAETCASVAVLRGHGKEIVEKCYQVGLHIGMSFQICDDLLDYNSKSHLLGKPVLNDLSAGLITLPLLFAIPDHKELHGKVKSGLDVETIMPYVSKSLSFERCKHALLLHMTEAHRFLEEIEGSTTLSSEGSAIIRYALDNVTRVKG
ncbi:polyprenyl synthetase family member protein [Theileria equi strain WA]|uniref:Polyprenyl synthetase family member protein n=1 Tax=Theileria equi strain WA TaxID=1537102 RepID=L1LCN4_THEEQ|nr:polyprenyl synthetase family member protein [Theileria equi strain WA]EKX73010.1 polyprenyl synthetase family member protein [Theileria equi strain WA]|eukprot:XP_004832462.1 polyprenyl synthetase family member protein [Theileria equi strain WA]